MSRFQILEFGESPVPFGISPATPTQQEFVAEADAAFGEARLEDALELYARALELNPANSRARANQARALVELGEFREAHQWAGEGLKTTPDNAELLALKAVGLARSGARRAARSAIEAALDQRGASATIWIAHGDVLLATGDSNPVPPMRNALTLDPKNSLNHWLIARTCHHYTLAYEAAQFAQAGLLISPARAALWVELARAEKALRNPAASATAMQKALELDPTLKRSRRLRKLLR